MTQQRGRASFTSYLPTVREVDERFNAMEADIRSLKRLLVGAFVSLVTLLLGPYVKLFL